MSVRAGRRSLGLASLAAVCFLAAAGCGGPQTRDVEIWLGKNAEVTLDGEPISVNASGPTLLEIPVRARNVLRVAEPRKPVLIAELRTLMNPPPTVEDALVLDSSANVLVVNTGTAQGMTTTGGAGVQLAFEHPFARLRDVGGPYFLPAEGQGVVVACDAEDAEVRIDTRPALPRGTSLATPAAVTLEPGIYRLEVVRRGRRTYGREVTVRANEYQFFGVRLAPERAEDVDRAPDDEEPPR